MNSPPAQEERDCHDPVIADSKSKKENAVNGVGGLTNTIWDKKKSISLPRGLTHYVEYI